MTEQTTPQITEQQRQQWLNEQFKKATKYLAENGVVVSTVDDAASRYLYPLWAVLKVKAMDGAAFWVLSGDLPVDFISAGNAANGRDALRHFVMSWQLKAENIQRSGIIDQTQLQFAAIMQNRAEQLYKFVEKDEIWGSV